MKSLHDLHLWSLTADLPAASVHLGVSVGADRDLILSSANKILQSKYGIHKTTVQVLFLYFLKNAIILFSLLVDYLNG